MTMKLCTFFAHEDTLAELKRQALKANISQSELIRVSIELAMQSFANDSSMLIETIESLGEVTKAKTKRKRE